MNQIDRNKILKMLGILALVFVIVGMASHFCKKNSMTLDEYAKLHPELAQEHTSENEPEDTNPEGADGTGAEDASGADSSEEDPTEAEDNSEDASPAVSASMLTGALLNGGTDGQAMLEQRISYTAPGTDAPSEDFYYEPLSENLRRYITGVSYPAYNAQKESGEEGSQPTEASGAPAITYDELRYVHILHYDFEGLPVEGELICNAAIAQDLLEIFYELYRSEYQIEKVLLIDEYDGDDTASMEDNNTSCFNYRVVEGSTSLSKHALGLALDINPFYNPYITYNKDGCQNVSPADAQKYADRDMSFPYKIDEDDLCFKLFTEHGFIWGGNWNSVKDYQHFQKTID